MAKVYALKAIGTSKLDTFQLKPTDVLHCFLSEGSAASFALSQLDMAEEDRRMSWGIPNPEKPDRQFGLGMTFIRYELDLPGEVLSQMVRAQRDPARPENYAGAIQMNGAQMPEVHAYIVGRDDGGGRKYLWPGVDLKAFVQARKDACVEKQQQAQARVDYKMEHADEIAAQKAENMRQGREKARQTHLDNMRSDPDTPGGAIISKAVAYLRDNGYHTEAKQLEATFHSRYLRNLENDQNGLLSAHEALVKVFTQLQKSAVKKDDFEMATYAHNTVKAAREYLGSLAQDRASQGNQPYATNDELSAFGLNPDSRDEWDEH